ncbi:MAG: hypothetical protein K6B67_06700 [Lachnospiraceae bacterium]|nr:hypothetical protein [Lachnospiraceae bacterium]
MLKDLKLGFKLLRYGYKIKMNIVIVAIFLAIAIIVEYTSQGENVIGGFYLMLIGMFVYQMVISTDISAFVASSPMQRKLQVNIPVITSTAAYLLLYTVLLIERVFMIKAFPEREYELINSLIMILIMLFVANIYCAICFKYYAIGFILLFVFSFFVGFTFGVNGIDMFMVNLPLSIVGIIGYGVIFAGAGVQYAIGSLLYRKPLSEFAFRGIFKDM